jgi:hypothetical protein
VEDKLTMANDLIVSAGSIITLDKSMPADSPHQPEHLSINKLEDLVKFQIVKSASTLDLLLDTAKTVTAEKLHDESTHRPFVPIRGTNRPDLRRFGAFISRVPDVSTNEINPFWRIARTIDPNLISSVSVSDTIAAAVTTAASRRWDIIRFSFQDITVEEGARLQVSNQVNYIQCNDLLIKRSGQILASNGSSLFITAKSIQGEQ